MNFEFFKDRFYIIHVIMKKDMEKVFVREYMRVARKSKSRGVFISRPIVFSTLAFNRFRGSSILYVMVTIFLTARLHKISVFT